jgi:hypothetical protein
MDPDPLPGFGMRLGIDRGIEEGRFIEHTLRTQDSDLRVAIDRERHTQQATNQRLLERERARSAYVYWTSVAMYESIGACALGA